MTDVGLTKDLPLHFPHCEEAYLGLKALGGQVEGSMRGLHLTWKLLVKAFSKTLETLNSTNSDW